ncbi:MAG: zinc ribbon domain-containing protein, partial [Candidatus Asgardarchaeia archaeon]
FNASKQCSRCGSMNTKRPSQGIFICEDCGCKINADVSGAKNVLKRAMGYMLYPGLPWPGPKGGAFPHSPQPLKLPVEALSLGRRSQRYISSRLKEGPQDDKYSYIRHSSRRQPSNKDDGGHKLIS